MRQKGIGSVALIIGIVGLLFLLGLSYYLGKQQASQLNPSSNANKNESSPENAKQSCYRKTGCWVEVSEGKMGYGELQGFYRSIKKANVNCDSFEPMDKADPVFNNLSSGDWAEDDTPVLSIDMKNLSFDTQQKIKQSTSSHPVTIKVVQVPTFGHDYLGCMPSSFYILDVKN